MGIFVSYLLAVSTGLLGIPIAVLFIEVIAAVVLTRQDAPQCFGAGFRGRVAVLVPAHNENTGLLPTLADIKAQLRVGDRLLVVADNCTDDTAAIAAASGVEVITRRDPEKIGKGYALEWGLQHLRADPPDSVIIIDADCRLSDNAIENLSTTSTLTSQPVQSLYVMTAPDQSTINYQIAEFAWRVKNWVRPLGLSALGLPCQLMGTGMAFPWALISSAKLASGQIVEDLNLGLDLAMAGNPPIFCPSAQVRSQFPTSGAAALRQRERWEHGHVDTILARAPRLILSSIKRRNLGLLALAMDLIVPPVVLLALLGLCAVFLASLSAWFVGSYAALVISVGSLAVLATTIVLSWMVFARDILPPKALWSIVPYALRKLSLYRRFVSGGRVSQWIRTDRE